MEQGIQRSGEIDMVSGYDKTPPEPRYDPDFTPAGRVIIIVIVALLAIGVYRRYFM